VLAKTGLRRSELAALDVGDINLEHRTIRLHPTGKRTSEIAFFDEETSRMIQKWLARREKILKVKKTGEKALFLNKSGRRLAPESISGRVQHWATVAGLHDPDSKRLEDRYMAHCTRHWFSTRLDENGCPNTILKELRGDNRQSLGSEQGYIHVNRKKIQEWYEKCIPQLGI
jgi:integrase/recombinase XerD